MKLEFVPGLYAVCKIPSRPTQTLLAIPDWARGEFVSVSRELDNLTVVCEQTQVPADICQESDWRALRVAGPLAFEEIGILSELTGVLAEARISVFAVSTFDTDYLLVKSDQLAGAVEALKQRGHTLINYPAH